jgi:hypothetical protein
MRAMVVLAALLVAFRAGAAPASSLPVAIEKLNPAAIACGISEPQLERVAMRTLDASRYRPDPDAGGWLNARVTVTQARRGACAARVSVQMKAVRKPTQAGAVPNSRKRSRNPAIVLCSKNGDYTAPKDRFAVEIESAVEYSIRQCLGSLQY